MYSSTLEIFTEVFLAINQRELSPVPPAIGRRDDDINSYTNAADRSEAY